MTSFSISDKITFNAWNEEPTEANFPGFEDFKKFFIISLFFLTTTNCQCDQIWRPVFQIQKHSLHDNCPIDHCILKQTFNTLSPPILMHLSTKQFFSSLCKQFNCFISGNQFLSLFKKQFKWVDEVMKRVSPIIPCYMITQILE